MISSCLPRQYTLLSSKAPSGLGLIVKFCHLIKGVNGNLLGVWRVDQYISPPLKRSVHICLLISTLQLKKKVFFLFSVPSDSPCTGFLTNQFYNCFSPQYRKNGNSSTFKKQILSQKANYTEDDNCTSILSIKPIKHLV